MTKTLSWLSALLGLQLLIAAGLLWQSLEGRAAKPEPFLNFEPDEIDSIKIGDLDHTVTLTKKDGHWLIPALERLPAPDARIESILTRLKNFKPAWPVATTTASHKRFEVANDKFQRKVQFYQDGTVAAEWYLGTSPGFRKSHIRKADGNGVYTIAMSGFDLPVKTEDWLDKGLLRASEISGIKGPDYALEKTDGTWRFVKAGATDGESIPEPDQEKAQQLASALTGLQVLGVADKTPDSVVKTLEVTTPKGSWTYDFMQADDKNYISRNDRKTVFALSQFDFNRITGVDFAKLLKEKKETESEPGKAGEPGQDESSGIDEPVPPKQ